MSKPRWLGFVRLHHYKKRRLSGLRPLCLATEGLTTRTSAIFDFYLLAYVPFLSIDRILSTLSF